MSAPSQRVIEIPRTHNPFGRDGVVSGDDHVPHYDQLPESLVAMLRHWVSTVPDREAVVEVGGERLSYAELWRRAARVAGGLRAAGVQRNDRVAVRYPSGVAWVVAFWGTLMAGGVVVAVNIRSTPVGVAFILEDAGVTVDLAADSPLPDGEPFTVDDLRLGDVAALFYTSGTTAQPKGVPTTHEAFLTNARNAMRCLGIPDDIGAELRTLISVPLFHVTGCNTQLLVAAAAGGTAIIMPALDVPGILTVIPDEKITLVIIVPAVYALLLRHPNFPAADVSNVRWVAYGGAAIAPSLVKQLHAAFPGASLMNGYGMTESASLMTALPNADAAAHADSIGYAVPSVDLAVAPIGDDPSYGELLTRGGNVTNGYWRRPEADAATFIDGWLHTGDIVRVDDAGRVYIVDRIKDIINRGGENVSSLEVEAVLASAPGVGEAAVLAVPDDVMTEKVGALLFPADGTIEVEAVLEHCRIYLADFQVPQYVAIADGPLPRNAGGKVLKTELRGNVEWGPPLR